MLSQKTIRQLLIFLCALTATTGAIAQNPVIQTMYTADPAPMIYKDTVFLYTGHDEDRSTWFTMKDWHVYSTTDMVNWTDRGSPLSLKMFSWAKKDAWAGQCIPRNGKFYWYVPINRADGNGMAIGVAVGSTPTGPFRDALGHPLAYTGLGDIDPTVFIDDDGQAYLYWGNPQLCYVKLNQDMISYSGQIEKVPLTEQGFGRRTGDGKRSTQYEEGPWFYRRKTLYYMIYPAGGVPEHIAYSTSTGPTGLWHYQDTLMHIIRKGGAFTNHPGIIDYHGRSFFFYHNGALPGGGGFDRSVCVDEFSYLADGTIPVIQNTQAGVLQPVRNLNPFVHQEAETIAWGQGIRTVTDQFASNHIYITAKENGAYIKIRNVNFKDGARIFQGRVLSEKGGMLDLRIDSLSGRLLGTCVVKTADSAPKWSVIHVIVNKVLGIHDLYLVFKGEGDNSLGLDWWKFGKIN